MRSRNKKNPARMPRASLEVVPDPVLTNQETQPIKKLKDLSNNDSSSPF